MGLRTDRHSAKHGLDSRSRAKREVGFSLVLLLSLVVVLGLALRGVFSAMWHLPHACAAIVATLALVSLLTMRGFYWKRRLLLALAIFTLAFLLPRFHLRGVLAKTARYEHVGSRLVGVAAPPLPYAASFPPSERSSGEIDTEGRILLLNFWATWCKPCVEEMPLLEEFWRHHHDRGIEVVGVTRPYRGRDELEESRQVATFLADRDITYPIVIVDRSSATHEDYEIESLPASVLIMPDGTVAAFGAGVRGTQRLMQQAAALVSP